MLLVNDELKVILKEGLLRILKQIPNLSTRV